MICPLCHEEILSGTSRRKIALALTKHFRKHADLVHEVKDDMFDWKTFHCPCGQIVALSILKDHITYYGLYDTPALIRHFVGV